MKVNLRIFGYPEIVQEKQVEYLIFSLLTSFYKPVGVLLRHWSSLEVLHYPLFP